ADRPVAAGSGEVTLDLPDGAAVGGDLFALTATVDADRWAETTFAYRTLGAGGGFATIAVAEDDTPRVYAAFSAHEAGTPLEVRGVLTDADGVAGDSALVWVGQDLALTPPRGGGEEPGGTEVTIPGSHNAAMGCAADW